MLGIALALVFWVVGGTARDGAATPYCDMAELNHVCGPDGEVQFTQLIAWEWNPRHVRHQVADWRFVDEWSKSGKRLDVSNKTESRSLRFGIFRETWTEHDPERENKVLFPINERRRVW